MVHNWLYTEIDVVGMNNFTETTLLLSQNPYKNG